MPVKTPNWFVWTSPLCAIMGAWLLGVHALQGGFWAIVFVALVCALLPYVVFRIVWRLHNKFLNG